MFSRKAVLNGYAKERFYTISENMKLWWYHLHPLKIYKTGVYPPSVDDINALAQLIDVRADSPIHL